jgi:hypothetical protein
MMACVLDAEDTWRMVVEKHSDVVRSIRNDPSDVALNNLLDDVRKWANIIAEYDWGHELEAIAREQESVAVAMRSIASLVNAPLPHRPGFRGFR